MKDTKRGSSSHPYKQTRRTVVLHKGFNRKQRRFLNAQARHKFRALKREKLKELLKEKKHQQKLDEASTFNGVL